MAKLGPKIEDANRIACPVDGIEIFVRHEREEVWIQIRQRNEVRWQIAQTSFSTKGGDIHFTPAQNESVSVD
jgi:hypothetical protein